mmetsp:Transcript_14886/g.20163  ORF Transcript_14886/g.20163 Transcript_14886/m.20163 type:complete len:129 (-) Transcript_14886:171-557(-)
METCASGCVLRSLNLRVVEIGRNSDDGPLDFCLHPSFSELFHGHKHMLRDLLHIDGGIVVLFDDAAVVASSFNFKGPLGAILTDFGIVKASSNHALRIIDESLCRAGGSPNQNLAILVVVAHPRWCRV